ncbi:MAG: VCBS domain-containing protein, partial [Cyanobium sp.]
MPPLSSSQEGTYTWFYGDASQALQYSVSYNTIVNRWTVNMQKGSMDLNAIWWSNNDTIAQGQINLSKADNSLNMQGTGVVWDGYQKISATGLSGTEHNGSSLLTAGSTYTYTYSATQGVDLESWIAAGTLTLGIRATSVNGSSGIKEVNVNWDVFTPNMAPVGVNDSGTATEAGGTNNGTPGSDAIGNVLTNDTDVDGPLKIVSAVRSGGIENSGTAGIVGTALSGLYGSLTLNTDGTYIYVIDNNKSSVQALKAGDSLIESFNYTVSDGSLSDTAVLAITITGANDNATITVNGTPDTAVTEAGGDANAISGDPSASGDLDVSDVDSGQALFQTPASLAGTYGDFTFNAATGIWGYT